MGWQSVEERGEMREKSPVPSASSLCAEILQCSLGAGSAYTDSAVTAVHESTLHTYTRAFPSDTVPRGAFTKGVSTPTPTRTRRHSQLCSIKRYLLYQDRGVFSPAALQEAGGLSAEAKLPRCQAAPITVTPPIQPA